MESYMTEEIKFGGYVVDGIDWLDDDTACLYFEEFKEDDCSVMIVVEYWLDEDSWHFRDQFYDEEDNYIDSCDTTHLSDKEKDECMEFILDWIKSWNE